MKHLGIITALLPEARCLVKNPRKAEVQPISDNISLIVSGMGQQRAEAATMQLLDQGARSLIVTGTCGALSPALQAGDIVLPEIVMMDSTRTMRVSKHWHEHVCEFLRISSVPVETKNLYSSATVIDQSTEKNNLYRATSAVAVDMESAAVVALAQTRQVPVLVIRSVIDPADFSIPGFIMNNSDIYGDPGLYPLIKSCIFDFGRLKQMLRMAADYQRAKKSLQFIGSQLEVLASLANGEKTP